MLDDIVLDSTSILWFKSVVRFLSVFASVISNQGSLHGCVGAAYIFLNPICCSLQWRTAYKQGFLSDKLSMTAYNGNKPKS